MIGIEILNGIYGIIAKNANGYLTKKQAGKYNIKLLGKDIAFGVIAFGIGYGAKSLLGVTLAETQVINTGAYMLLTQLVDKWYYAVKARFTGGVKFKFFG